MKIKYFLAAITFIISINSYAQTGRQVSGVVKDSTGVTLPGTTLKLLTGTDSLIVATDMNGRFTFTAVPVNQFSLVVFSIGYKPLKRRFILRYVWQHVYPGKWSSETLIPFLSTRC